MDPTQEAQEVAAARAEQDKLAAQEAVRRNHINAIATQIYVNAVDKVYKTGGGEVDLTSAIQFSVGAAVAYARNVLGYSVQIVQSNPQPQQGATP